MAEYVKAYHRPQARFITASARIMRRTVRVVANMAEAALLKAER